MGLGRLVLGAMAHPRRTARRVGERLLNLYQLSALDADRIESLSSLDPGRLEWLSSLPIDYLQLLTDEVAFEKEYEKRVDGTANYIQEILDKHFKGETPEFGLEIGSGLGSIADVMTDKVEFDYKDVPGFTAPTVDGHEGKLVIGRINGVLTVGLKGRRHYYEVAHERAGILKTVFPVDVLANLGVKNYFVTNAAGGLNKDYKEGDVMVIRSQRNEIPNPLLGRLHVLNRVDDDKKVARFVAMDDAYHTELTLLLYDEGQEFDKEHVHEGIYAGLEGSTYETPEDVQHLRNIGCDDVGMSTTPGVIKARQRGMNVVGLSLVTNEIDPAGSNPATHEEVTEVAERPEVKYRLTNMVLNFFGVYKQIYMDRPEKQAHVSNSPSP